MWRQENLPTLLVGMHVGAATGVSSKKYRTTMCMCAHSVVSDSLWPHGLQPPGFPVHEILQGKIFKCIAISSARGSSWPRDRTHISCISMQIFFFYHWSTWKDSISLPRTTICFRNSISACLSEENKNSNSKLYLHLNVHCSIIYNTQDMEATQVSINWWMVKENVGCACVYICT